MKKYSSYADLKIPTSPKPYPIQSWANKITNTPGARKGFDIPLTLISRQPFAIPMTTKYSAGYLQRKKMFSSKKENKDSLNLKNIVPNTNNQNIASQKIIYDQKILDGQKNVSKPKKNSSEDR